MDHFPTCLAHGEARRGEARLRMLSTSLRKDGDIGRRHKTRTQSSYRVAELYCIMEQQQKIIIRIDRGIFKQFKRNTKPQG